MTLIVATMKIENMTLERLRDTEEYALVAIKRNDVLLYLGVNGRVNCFAINRILVSDAARQILAQAPFDLEVLMFGKKIDILNERDKMFSLYKPILNHPKYNLYKNMRGLRIKCLETGDIYKDQKAVAEAYNVTIGAVSHVLSGQQTTLKGHTFVIDDSYL
jgi:hypothetical protein